MRKLLGLHATGCFAGAGVPTALAVWKVGARRNRALTQMSLVVAGSPDGQRPSPT
jgi:hypothetical protein